MHRCSSGSSHGGNMVGGPCSCGVLHHTQSNSSFSTLFSMPNHHKPYDHIHHETSYDHHHMYPFASPSSSVDCTLSLGTPSPGLTDNDVVSDDRHSRNGERRSGNCVSNFCWDLLQPNKSSPSSHHKNSNRGGNINDVNKNDRRQAWRQPDVTPLGLKSWQSLTGLALGFPPSLGLPNTGAEPTGP